MTLSTISSHGTLRNTRAYCPSFNTLPSDLRIVQVGMPASMRAIAISSSVQTRIAATAPAARASLTMDATFEDTSCKTAIRPRMSAALTRFRISLSMHTDWIEPSTTTSVELPRKEMCTPITGQTRISTPEPQLTATSAKLTVVTSDIRAFVE